MKGRSRVKNVGRIRKLLKEFPIDVRGQMAEEMDKTGRQLVSFMRGRTPSKTGALRAGLSYRLFPKSATARGTLKLRVGLLGSKAARSKLFYGRILDLGRKEQVVAIKRGPRAGAKMKVGSIAAKHFVTGSYPATRQRLTQALNRIMDRALRAAAAVD